MTAKDGAMPSVSHRSSLPFADSPTFDNNEEEIFKYETEDSDSGSSEDTEDASENENYQNCEYTEIKEQMYQDKLAHLKKQLLQLNDGTLPEWTKMKKKIDLNYRERLRINSVVRELEQEIVKQDYLNDQAKFRREFEEKKAYLKEQLINELEDKQKTIEQERHSNELTGDCIETKPLPTRKLRRRANEPPGQTGYVLGEKRRKPVQATLIYLLNEEDIFEDLKIINKGKALSTAKPPTTPPESTSSGGGSSSPATFARDARIEDGKLFYEKRWFRRGQTVFVEPKEGGNYSAVISAIGSEAIWVRRSDDNTKVRFYLTQLNKGKFSLKRRAV